jgi:toxin ParE1/3/4
MAVIRRTAAARLDYLQIFLHIGEQDITAAEKLLRTFDEKLRMLADMPGMGPARPDLGKSLRTYPVGKYLLIYRSVTDGIELVRAVHGSRNLRRLLRGRR